MSSNGRKAVELQSEGTRTAVESQSNRNCNRRLTNTIHPPTNIPQLHSGPQKSDSLSDIFTSFSDGSCHGLRIRDFCV